MRSYQSYKTNYTDSLEKVGKTGYIQSVQPPVVYVNGLPNVHYGEVIYFETGEMGMVMSIQFDICEVLVFSRDPLRVGTQAARANVILQMPVGELFLGKSIDPLGLLIDENDYMQKPQEFRLLDSVAPGIDSREKINQPFETGVAVVDLMIPLGHGQRELVLGDRKTGKTEFLMQSLFTQAKKGTICIYAGVGKKKADIKHVEDFIARNGIVDSCVLLSSSSTDPLGLIYITPYAAMTLAEYFKDSGKDVLLIIDDLSTHAKFYREISLISKRFPGRNSYPGDIFYAHSRLLERAGNFKTSLGVRSITCLPVAETIESDISGYIQTNLMSITDGHIYFDKDLFEQGRRPAVNYFLSVTRVGRQTQTRVRWGINRELSSFMTLFEKTQRFIHFGAEINEGIKATLSMGSRLLSFFDQPMGSIVKLNVQIVLFCLLWSGTYPETNLSRLEFFTRKATELYGKDENFKKNIDTLVSESADFNALLGKVSTKGKELMSYIDAA